MKEVKLLLNGQNTAFQLTTLSIKKSTAILSGENEFQIE